MNSLVQERTCFYFSGLFKCPALGKEPTFTPFVIHFQTTNHSESSQ